MTADKVVKTEKWNYFMENMINFTQDASTTNNQMKTVIKQKMVEFFIETLTEQFGEENVHMLRTGSNSLTNEIGFKVSLTDSDGFPQDVVVTIDPKIKNWFETVRSKQPVPAFDFEEAATAYDDYVIAKENTKAANARKKKEKIARDIKERAERAQRKADALKEDIPEEEKDINLNRLLRDAQKMGVPIFILYTVPAGGN